MLGSARGRWCNSSGLLTQLLTRRRSFGMGLFIDKALSKGDCLAVALFPVIALNWRSAAQPARAGRSGRSAGGARRSSSASRARELSAIKANAPPFTADFSAPCFGEHPVAEPRGAAGGRSSKYHQHRCRRVAASVVLAAHAAARMSPCGGECRVGRARCRAGPSSPARRRIRGADPRRRGHRPFATNKRSPPTNDRRRPPRSGRPLPLRAPHRRLAQLAHPAGRSRMLIALHRLAPVKASDAISPLNAVV